VKAVRGDLPCARRRAPEGFQLRAVSRRERPEDLQVEGHGLTIEEWLRYASPESLSLSCIASRRRRSVSISTLIPRQVDEYQQHLDAYVRQDARQRLSNPVWHIHSGAPSAADMPLSYAMLLTLVASSNAESAETLWGFIGRYRPGVTPQTHPKLDALVGYAIHYFRDFVLPQKRYREAASPNAWRCSTARRALATPADATAEQIQDVVYEVGRREPFLDKTGKIKTRDGKPGVALDWFNMLYQVLLARRRVRVLARSLPSTGRQHRRHDRRRPGAFG